MAQSQIITLRIDVAELLMGFSPKMAGQYMALSGAAKGLQGTELTVTVDISGTGYSFVIKNGQDFQVSQGVLENPMVFLKIALQDIEKLAQLKHADMLFAMQESLTRQKYDVLKRIKGTATFALQHEDGSETPIVVTFNGGNSPKAILRLSMENAKTLVSKKENPVQMFMAGKLRIEGDLGFAMSTQPLFT